MPKHRLRKQNRNYCQHCDEYLSRTGYFKHRKAYYNPVTDRWSKKASIENVKRPGPKPCHVGTESNQDRFTSYRNDANDEKDIWSCSSSGEDDMEMLSKDQDADDFEKNEVHFDGASVSEDNQHIHENNESLNGSSDSCSCDEDETESDREPEIWDDNAEYILNDISTNEEPLPEPRKKQSISMAITTLLQWFAYFILFWQTTCKISDNGLEWLLCFLFQFLQTLGLSCNNEYLIEMVMMFPSSLYLLRQFVKLDRDDFTKYAVCPECSKLYHLDDCTRRIGDRIEAKTCTNKPFKRGRKKECGAVLARKFVTVNNKTVFYPMKVYCFKSVINQLESILKRPGLPDLCEKWRRREVDSGVMADIYDGRVWNDFQVFEGKEFLKAKHNIAFGINVDWFQPYKRRKDRSVGAIYLVILNLPREERYKWENVIIAGIIPEMKKEPKSLNTFLDPIVEELRVLWKGVRLQTSTSSVPLIHRAALLLASSDIPASRKLCGFKGHSAHRGCSKCFKFFPSTFTEKTDYSGFDVKNWPPRDNRTHRRQALEVKNASNVTNHEKLAKKHGVYYSSLLKLEYFDAVRMTVIDPMHNLFLGTSKNFFKLLLTEEILDKKALETLEQKLSSYDVPTGFGRLPKNILSNYGCFTASQWKNWTLIYSTYCLNGLIPEVYFRCWQTFVLACQYMACPVISEVDITRANGLFIKFGEQFENAFGKAFVTPNMHLHCHLKDCVLDFGPVHAFWCFSFERYNGILGDTAMNGRSIEVQLMRKLLAGKFVFNTVMPEEFKETFLPFFQYNTDGLSDNHNTINAVYFMKSAGCYNLQEINWSDLALISLPKSYRLMNLDNDDLSLLLNSYKILYPEEDLQLSCLSNVARKFTYVCLGTEKFGSNKESRSTRSSRVMASWAGEDGEIELSSFVRPGQVKFYFQHTITVNGTAKQHVLSCVQWYKRDGEIDVFGKPSQVWRLKEFDNPGPAIFMPVQRIASTFAACVVKRTGIDKLVVSPIPRLFH